jgi:hypothetical protein
MAGKSARIDRSEAHIHAPGAMPPGEFALAIHRVYLTQVRLERSISSTIADLDRYRKTRLERQQELGLNETDTYKGGLVWGTSKGSRFYTVLPQVRGLDGVWREIPRDVLGDFNPSAGSGDETAPPIMTGPDGHAS